MTQGWKINRILMVLGMMVAAAFLAVSIQAAAPAGTVSAQSFDEDDCNDFDEAEEDFDDEDFDELIDFCNDEDEDEDEDHDEDEFSRDELDEAQCDHDDSEEGSVDEDEDEDEEADESNEEQDCDDEVVRIIRRVPVITAPRVVIQQPTVVAAAAPAPAPAPVAAAPAPAPAPQVQLPRTGEGPVGQNQDTTLLAGAGLLLVAGLALAYRRVSRAS